MGKPLLCPFYTCKAETTDYCTMHRHLLPAIQRVVEHHDPEGICSFNVNVANLLPMVKMLEEQYRDNKQLERRLQQTENDLHRIMGGI